MNTDSEAETPDFSEELFRELTLTIDPGQAAQRIDKFLSIRLGQQVSRTRIQEAIRVGNLTVNEKAVRPSYLVRPLDKIQLIFPKSEDHNELGPENIPLDIIYEDDDLMVINKKPGMVVHPGLGNWTGTLVNALLYHFKQLPGATDSLRPGLVHRIDKDTSGLIVVAKTEYALAHLGKQFFDRTIDRNYLAVVWGNVVEDKGTIEGHIGRHSRERMQFEVFVDGSSGKHAITHYQVEERLNYVTVVRCKLETGRTHQIRVHMKHIGHTLFNDSRYGGDKIIKGTLHTKYRQFIENCFIVCPRQALHAKTLGFVHPVTGKQMFFESPLPEDISAMLKKWRTYWSNPNAIFDLE